MGFLSLVLLQFQQQQLSTMSAAKKYGTLSTEGFILELRNYSGDSNHCLDIAKSGSK